MFYFSLWNVLLYSASISIQNQPVKNTEIMVNGHLCQRHPIYVNDRARGLDVPKPTDYNSLIVPDLLLLLRFFYGATPKGLIVAI